jgi:beta-N-acetylhexosaminidase
MAVGAAGSEDLALLKGRTIGAEARLIGVPWVLSPSAAGARSFGRDAAAAGRLGRATLRGLHAAGVLGCVKGFPGVIDGSPFAELAPEADAVLVRDFRASGDDLRRKFDFQGIIAVEACPGSGFAESVPEREAVEQAVLAGVDVLLGPGDPDLAIQIIEDAAKAGRLAETAVDAAAERILRAKEFLGLFRERMTDVRAVEGLMRNEANRAAARKVAEAAVTLVRGTAKAGPEVEVLTVRDTDFAGDVAVFERELARGTKVRNGARSCVAAVFFRPRPGKDRPDPAQVGRVKEAAGRCGELLVVSFGDPSAVREFPEAAGVVCAYGEDEFCQGAAAGALLGEIPFPGRLPVPL